MNCSMKLNLNNDGILDTLEGDYAVQDGCDAEFTFITASTFYTETLSKLHAECFDNPWDVASMLDVLIMPGSFGFIASNGDAPCGLILCQQTAASDDTEKGEAEILSIGVVPSMRGKGCAKQLLEKAFKQAEEKGVGKLFLEVSENNSKAVNLYKKNGFEQISVRKKYYRNENPQADALILAKNI